MRLALALLWLAAATARPQETPTFPAGTERVTVDVVVTDKDGRPIAGLGRDDFVLEEEGAVQRILEFEAIDVSAAAEAGAEAGADEGRIATNARAEGPGRHFLVVFDDVNLSVHNTDRVRDALRSFLGVQLREGDHVTIAGTGGGSFWTGRIARDADDLAAFLGTLRGLRVPDTSPQRISDLEAMRIHVLRDNEAIDHVVLRRDAYGLLGPGLGADAEDAEGALQSARTAERSVVEAAARDVYAQAQGRYRLTLARLEAAVSSLAGRRGRRAVILASDGFVEDPTLDELRRVREAARRVNAAVYFLDARGLGAPEVAPLDMPVHPDPTNLFNYNSLERVYAAEATAGTEALAAETGGLTIRGTDLAPGLARVSLESRTFYLLGYEPDDQRRDGRFRKINVRVKRPGVVIRARKGYHAGKGGLGAERPAPDAPAVPRGMLEERPDIPLRITAYVLGDAGAGRATVLLSAEADPALVTLEEQEGVLVGAVESVATVTSRDTGEVGTGRRVHELALRPETRRRMALSWIPVTHSFELPSGRYQATLSVRDRGNGRVGSVRLAFDVPDLGTLRLTTPILSDSLLPGNGPGAPASPAPLARRAFEAGRRLACRFEVAGVRRQAGAEPRVLVTHEVFRRGGARVAGTAPTPLLPGEGGALAGTFTLTLNRPGDYELRLHARDERTGEEASAVEPFEVREPAP